MARTERRTFRIEDAVEIYKAIRPEFEYEADIFSPDTARVRKLKWVCSKRLDRAEKALIYLYAELGSIRDLAALLNVARSTLADELTRIREKVRNEMEGNGTDV